MLEIILLTMLSMFSAGSVSEGSTTVAAPQQISAPTPIVRELPMPLDQVKNIINLTKTSWVAFRDYDGNQLIYFTHLESWKCGIIQVKYSLNSQSLDQVWQLAECDLGSPNAVTKDMPYIRLPLNTAQNISVQITFDDGTQTEIVTFDKP